VDGILSPIRAGLGEGAHGKGAPSTPAALVEGCVAGPEPEPEPEPIRRAAAACSGAVCTVMQWAANPTTTCSVWRYTRADTGTESNGAIGVVHSLHVVELPWLIEGALSPRWIGSSGDTLVFRLQIVEGTCAEWHYSTATQTLVCVGGSQPCETTG
jgi:hypothetical protein